MHFTIDNAEVGNVNECVVYECDRHNFLLSTSYHMATRALANLSHEGAKHPDVLQQHDTVFKPELGSDSWWVQQGIVPLLNQQSCLYSLLVARVGAHVCWWIFLANNRYFQNSQFYPLAGEGTSGFFSKTTCMASHRLLCHFLELCRRGLN